MERGREVKFKLHNFLVVNVETFLVPVFVRLISSIKNWCFFNKNRFWQDLAEANLLGYQVRLIGSHPNAWYWNEKCSRQDTWFDEIYPNVVNFPLGFSQRTRECLFEPIWSIYLINGRHHDRDKCFTIVKDIKVGIKYFLWCNVSINWSNLGKP